MASVSIPAGGVELLPRPAFGVRPAHPLAVVLALAVHVAGHADSASAKMAPYAAPKPARQMRPAAHASNHSGSAGVR
jgi:hypothetical protein